MADDTTIEQDVGTLAQQLTRASGDAAPPPQAPAAYGSANAAAIQETADAINRVVETTIAGWYAAADEADKEAKHIRATADQAATSLRLYAKRYATDVTNLLMFCHKAEGDMADRVKEFQDMVAPADGRQ